MIHRHITSRVVEALSDTPVVLINGARQTGKSTLVRSLERPQEERQYLTFDDPGILAAVKRDPNGFVAGLSRRVTLDEVQHVPELFSVIKMAVDQKREPGRFLLTGSADILLLPKLSESLAGRVELHTLWPFSQGELGQIREDFIDTLFAEEVQWPVSSATKLSRREIFERVLTGGYPVVIERQPERRQAWFESYLTTILQRDVRDLSAITDLTAVPRLLAVIASRVGNLLNFADLSRNMALPQTTLKRYFALLEMTFLVQLLQPWSVNLGQRVIHTPKAFVNDTGLLAHLLGLSLDRLETDPGLAGSVLENFVLMELQKQATWSKARPHFFFWRTVSGQEVDIVFERSDGRMVGVEIKAGSTLASRDVRGLDALAKAAGRRWIRGVILYTGTEIVPLAANIHALPLPLIWTPNKFE